MKYDWITLALSHKGVLTTSESVHGIRATMNWKGHEPVCGGYHSTIPDAINSLNSALEDDAADECCPTPDEDDGGENDDCGMMEDTDGFCCTLIGSEQCDQCPNQQFLGHNAQGMEAAACASKNHQTASSPSP